MELEQAMENRRSIRKYEAKPVETEKIRKMIQAAGLAPSWKNSQVYCKRSFRLQYGRQSNQ